MTGRLERSASNFESVPRTGDHDGCMPHFFAKKTTVECSHSMVRARWSEFVDSGLEERQWAAGLFVEAEGGRWVLASESDFECFYVWNLECWCELEEHLGRHDYWFGEKRQSIHYRIKSRDKKGGGRQAWVEFGFGGQWLKYRGHMRRRRAAKLLSNTASFPVIRYGKCGSLVAAVC